MEDYKNFNEKILAWDNGKFQTDLKILAYVVKPNMRIFFLDTSHLDPQRSFITVFFRNNNNNINNNIENNKK